MKTKMSQKRKTKWLAALLCYAAALVIWLAVGGVRMGLDTLRQSNGTLAAQSLPMGSFTFTTGVRFDDNWRETGRMDTTDPDPQLILDFPEGRYVRSVLFDATALNRGPGNITLYYTTAPEEDFSDARQIWAQPGLQGGWVFNLGGKTVYSLRLDPDSVGGVHWRVWDIVINPSHPVLTCYFLPTPLWAFLLLVLPALCWALIYEAVAFIQPILARRRFERRFEEKGSGKARRGAQKTGQANKG